MVSRKISIKKKDLNVEESFLREYEKEKILKFISSKSKILHIAGNPGTGKTITVKYLLKNKKYGYINYLTSDNFTVTENIIVFDEFDKFYNQKRSECLNFLQKNAKKKIITLSNDLLFTKDCLFFKSYSKEEIIEIVKKKINSDRISDLMINLISLKESNDLRKILSVCNDLLLKKTTEITIQDLNCRPMKRESIHQQLIHEMKEQYAEKKQVFQNYIEKCKKLKITGLDRIDFTSIYENID